MSDWNRRKVDRKIEWYMKHEDQMYQVLGINSSKTVLQDIREFNEAPVDKTTFLMFFFRKHNIQVGTAKWEQAASVLEDELTILRSHSFIVPGAYGPMLTKEGEAKLAEPHPKFEWVPIKSSK
jgi:hypothetical protein